MDAHVTALALNTQGSAMMAAGNYEVSLAAFFAALNRVKPCFGQQEEPRNPWKLATTKAFAEHVSSPVFEIFPRCFVVVPNDSDCIQVCNSEESGLLVAAMMYNYGLAHHLLGYQEVNAQSSHLQKANRLYRSALRIVQQLEFCTHDSVKLFLAATNNIAAISLELLDYTTFGSCRRRVDVLLTTSEDEFYNSFFVENFASAVDVNEWPAPAA